MLFLQRSLLCVVTLGIMIAASAGMAADRLPFPDGSYASNVKFCKMSRDQAYGQSEMAFYDIRGKEISLYESSCAVRDVSTKGSVIEFKKACESEGESTVDRVTWKKLSANSFSDENGQVWTGCGRFVD